MVIRWKVTTKGRESSIVYDIPKYKKLYHKGTIVKATENTLGIMTFETDTYAKHFAQDTGLIILKVKPIGKGSRPKGVAFGLNEKTIDLFYSRNMLELEVEPPKGTICYPAVEMLE